MIGTITACIAAHPARFGHSLPSSPPGAGKLARALQSVMRQTRQPDAIVVGNDRHLLGAASNRQNILDMVTTDWMAWLDSDDEWYPEHLEKLERCAEQTGWSFLFPGYDGHDPLGHFGLPFNPETPHHTTITFMVRTELAQQVGFGEAYRTVTPERVHGGEDWLHIVGICKLIVERGLTAGHLAERTWVFNADGFNTSGVPGQGDAV